jgi:hypothetical protein
MDVVVFSFYVPNHNSSKFKEIEAYVSSIDDFYIKTPEVDRVTFELELDNLNELKKFKKELYKKFPEIPR